MPDLPLRAATREPDRPAPGARIRREVGLLAGRLSRLLDRAAAPAACRFLDAAFEAVAGGRPLAAWLDDASTRRPAGPPDPLDRLADGLALSPAEVDTLLLAGLAEEHEGFAAVLRALHPRGAPHATTGLAAQLFCHDPTERLLLRHTLESGRAVRAGALRLGEDAPFFERTLSVAEALWPVLQGLDVWPSALVPLATPSPMDGFTGWLASPAAVRAVSALARRVPCTVLVVADDEQTGLDRAAALARQAGVAAARIALPAGGALPLFALHALVRGLVPIVALSPGESGPGDDAAWGLHPGPVVVCARAGAVVPRTTRPAVLVPADRLRPGERREAWRALLPELVAEAASFAARYTLEPGGIAQVAADVRARAALEERPPRAEDVVASVSVRGAPPLHAGVQVIRPAAQWDDLVLPGGRKAQLREAIDRLLHRTRVLEEWRFLRGRPGGRGVRMLFSGPPGTGKTLSAEVLAHALGVDLLLVDVSRVVSKWIGETEKNLAQVFDTAERAQAVLCFDEADALFARRTEVSDAHDRWANLETAYLLARLERFEGLAVLATNLRQNVDPAFLRRLEFVLEFDEPGPGEREALWRRHLPATAPLAGDVDLAELAGLYPVPGGLIRNAAVAAAFRAAAEDGPITRNHVVRAMQREYEKAGRVFPGSPPGLAAA